MNKKVKHNIIIGTIISGLILIITVLSYAKHGYLNLSSILDTEKLGHFGDFIGGFLGTLLTILATLLIYLTYNNQKKELLKTKELLELQQFESTFFNMLKVHQELKNNISFNTENTIIREYEPISFESTVPLKKGTQVVGKHFFDVVSNDFQKLYKHFPHDNPNYHISKELDDKLENIGFGIKFEEPTCKNKIKEIKYKYDVIFENYASYLGDYFRNLYHILKFISTKKRKELNVTKNKEDQVHIEEKFKQYADILQSQMNFSELQLTFYNSLKFRKLRKLVLEFDFVENLHSSNLLSQDHLHFNSLGKVKTK